MLKSGALDVTTEEQIENMSSYTTDALFAIGMLLPVTHWKDQRIDCPSPVSTQYGPYMRHDGTATGMLQFDNVTSSTTSACKLVWVLYLHMLTSVS